ncbi:MAG: helix-turn-helix domain-containing protein [Candidatus Binatia bacterium]
MRRARGSHSISAMARRATGRAARADRPVTAVLDLLGRRWLLRVLWELRTEPLTFRVLRDRCNAMSPSVLNRRLGELRQAGVVAVEPRRGYRLTAEGRELVRALRAIDHWAERRALRSSRGTRHPARRTAR